MHFEVDINHIYLNSKGIFIDYYGFILDKLYENMENNDNNNNNVAKDIFAPLQVNVANMLGKLFYQVVYGY